MTNVHHLPTATPTPSDSGIPIGLHWRFEHKPPQCPRLIGYWPGRPDAVAARLKVELSPAGVTEADWEAAARVWSEYPGGAVELMLADGEGQ